VFDKPLFKHKCHTLLKINPEPTSQLHSQIVDFNYDVNYRTQPTGLSSNPNFGQLIAAYIDYHTYSNPFLKT